MRNIKDRMMRSWPRATLLMLGMVPVCLLALIVLNLILKSIPAVTDRGLGELFSTEFRDERLFPGPLNFGLLPAVWGTFMAAVIAVAIALPASLAMAVFSSEFPLGFLGRGIRGILGMLSGIPPIVYAIGAVIIVDLFIIPKFCSGFTFDTLNPVTETGRLGLAEMGISPEDWPPAGLPPWNPGTLPWHRGGANSTLLGGIMAALLVIPFMAPLIDDALRNVPAGLKEASLSLGANRWHTLKKVTLPLALPGIISATSIGALKAIGDVIIAGWVIGWASPGMPNPLWDILERVAPLAATGAGLLGGLGGQPPTPEAEPVAYFSTLMLLGLAFAIMGMVTLLQRRIKRRYSLL
jgi:phosphate transport system permease protein